MLNDIYEVTQDTLNYLYKFNINTGGNILIFGPSGIGKTEMALQAAKNIGYEAIYVNLSTLESPDLVGIPKEVNGVTTHAPVEFLPLRNSNKKPVVLIVDELDKAADELQNPMLELFQFRSINGKPLNIQAIIATGNRPDENANTRIISWALANRCSIFKVEPNFESWRRWAVNNEINPLIVGFLTHREDLLLVPNTSGDPTAYCHPSPRSWTYAAQDIDNFRESLENESKENKQSLIDFEYMLVAGRVGVSAALEFKIWLKHYRILAPEIKALIETGKMPNTSVLDLSKIMVFGIAGINAINNACKNKNIEKINKITNHVCKWLNTDDVAPDIVLLNLLS